MNAEQINAVGGWCGLIGVAFLVRDLMSLARYRDKPKEWAARLRRWAARVKAGWAATHLVPGGGGSADVSLRRPSQRLG